MEMGAHCIKYRNSNMIKTRNGRNALEMNNKKSKQTEISIALPVNPGKNATCVHRDDRKKTKLKLFHCALDSLPIALF